eukprot:GHVT01023860.1.p1 GENE.GHVT01023860.1~~GHVT01023860.1.p1  ORF type:complete len:548 (+),score=70.22 GHVT01023860.1:69-1646(+)
MTVEHKSCYSIFSEKDLSGIGDFPEYSTKPNDQLPEGIVPERYAFLVEQLLLKRAELVSKGVSNTGKYDVSVFPGEKSCIKVVKRGTGQTFYLDWNEFDSVAMTLATDGPKVDKFLAVCQTLQKIRYKLSKVNVVNGVPWSPDVDVTTVEGDKPPEPSGKPDLQTWRHSRLSKAFDKYNSKRESNPKTKGNKYRAVYRRVTISEDPTVLASFPDASHYKAVGSPVPEALVEDYLNGHLNDLQFEQMILNGREGKNVKLTEFGWPFFPVVRFYLDNPNPLDKDPAFGMSIRVGSENRPVKVTDESIKRLEACATDITKWPTFKQLAERTFDDKAQEDLKQKATQKKKRKAKKTIQTPEKSTEDKQKGTKKRTSTNAPVDLGKKVAPVPQEKGTDGGTSGDGTEASGSNGAPARSAFFTPPILVSVIVAALVGSLGVTALGGFLLRRARQKKKNSKTKKQLKSKAKEGPEIRFASKANKVSAKASDRLRAEASLMYEPASLANQTYSSSSDESIVGLTGANSQDYSG